MALPVIAVHSSGSDSNSGAGPGDGTHAGTVVSGTAAATDGAGTTITLDAGTDLSNVPNTGAAVLRLVDATAGARRFSKIVSWSGSGGATPTVVVAHAFGTSLSGKSFSIGGKRATIGGTESRLLFETTASGNGDLMPGWILRMLSGHTETVTSRITWRRAGDTTSGACILEGESGGTRPVLTANFDDILINVRNGGLRMKFMELARTGGAGTARAIDQGGGAPGCVFEDIKIVTGWNIGINQLVSPVIIGCQIGNTTSHGLVGYGDSGTVQILDSWIYSCAGSGIVLNGGVGLQRVYGCAIANCTQRGILDNTNSSDHRGAVQIEHNDFYLNGGSSYSAYERSTSAVNGSLSSLAIRNNYFHTNGYHASAGQPAIKFATSGITAEMLSFYATTLRRNGYYNNGTAGAATCSITGVEVGAITAAGPDNASYGTSGDYSKGSNFAGKAMADPTDYIGVGSATRSFVDIGCGQRQESGGSSGGVVVPSSIYGAEGLRVFA